MQRVPIGIAINALNHGFAINDEMLPPVLQGSFGDPWKALGPIIPAARD
jgi:hypothetical protein